MIKKIVVTENAPKAIGAYSQAIVIGGMLYSSGQIPIDPKTGNIIEGNIKVQTKQSMENLLGILQAEGLDFSDVIKTTIFIDNMDDFASVNDVYASYFEETYPARSCVEVSRLPKNVLIEIEVIAKCR